MNPKVKQRTQPTDWEHLDQKSIFQWYRMRQRPYLMFAIPNGGDRHAIVAAKLKAEGVISGIPDIAVVFPEGQVMWLEVKHQGGKRFLRYDRSIGKSAKGTLSPNQRVIHAKLEQLGHDVRVVYHLEDVREAIKSRGYPV